MNNENDGGVAGKLYTGTYVRCMATKPSAWHRALRRIVSAQLGNKFANLKESVSSLLCLYNHVT